MADRRLELGLLFAAAIFACAKPKPVTPSPRVPIASRQSPAPPDSSSRPAVSSPRASTGFEAPPIPSGDWAEVVAPEPRIRVGLSTRLSMVRLSAERDFWIGDGTRWVTARDVLVEPVYDPASSLESMVYRVSAGSFLNRAAANRRAGEIREELELPVSVDREPGTGRYRVLAGEMSTSQGAVVAVRGLQALGYDAREVSTNGEVPRPMGFRLASIGRGEEHIDGASILVVPAGRRSAIEVDGTRYRGFLHLFVNGTNSLSLVNVLHLEDYLRGVVPGELSPEAFPEIEALKAQAVAARTYALKHMGKYDAEGYDICSTPACQVYKGASAEHTLSDEAISKTSGETLRVGGRLIDPLYTSTCGGRTENAENVFSFPHSYLVSRACFLESTPMVLSSVREKEPLSIALSRSLGIVATGNPTMQSASFGEAWWKSPARHEEFENWLTASLERLGQKSCRPSASAARVAPEALSWGSLVDTLALHLCWDGRIPYLLTPPDKARFSDPTLAADTAQQARFAYAVSSGLVAPPPEGFASSGQVSRLSVFELISRLFEKQGLETFEHYRLSRFDGERLWLLEDAEDRKQGAQELLPQPFWVSPQAGLYRDSGSSSYAVSSLHLLPNDRVRVVRRGEQIQVLAVTELGGSFDRSSRFSHWTVHRERDVLGAELAAKHSLGSLLDIQPKRYGPSGRVAELELVGSTGSKILKGLSIRRALGLRENLFFVDRLYDRDGAVAQWVFTGRGWGHGVGMCQVGAYGMALAGFDHREILTHYYHGAQLEGTVSTNAQD